MKIFKNWLQSFFGSKVSLGGSQQDFVEKFSPSSSSVFPKYLFILTAPHSGGRLLKNILHTSLNVSLFNGQCGAMSGQSLFSPHPQHPQRVIIEDYSTNWYNIDYQPNWADFKKGYDIAWDLERPVLADQSLANLFRPKALENYFSNYGEVFFIAQIRNPYNCTSLSCEEWVERGKLLRWAILNLKRVLILRYEDLVQSPEVQKERLCSFIPELHSIDMGVDQRARLPTCNIYHQHPSLTTKFLKNVNKEEKNLFLSQEIPLLDFFGYKYLK